MDLIEVKQKRKPVKTKKTRPKILKKYRQLNTITESEAVTMTTLKNWANIDFAEVA